MKNKSKAAIVISISCALLTVGIIVQLNTMKDLDKTVGGEDFAQSDLRDEVLRWKEKYDNTAKEIEEAEKQLAEVREKSTENDDGLSETEQQIKNNYNLLGTTNLEGPGVEITVTDDKDINPSTASALINLGNYIVHYSDIMQIVNELKNAGAEAISVNGQRIVRTTSIRCIGNVIMINDEKVGAPFTIRAIGLPEMLEPALTRLGGYLQVLNDAGLETDVKRLDKVEIPKYTGAFQAKYMKTVK